MKKPCLTCSRVPSPMNCDDKTCRAWRRWFVERWETMRQQPRLLRNLQPEHEGMGIGGRRYALPHRIHTYLESDPCAGCLCPRDLCVVPCRVKRNWLTTRELLQ